jgi:hypothetical protein
MSYSIYTICTNNYRDSWELVKQSWLRTSASKIFIYTDDKEWTEKDRVQVIPLFDVSDDWLVNVGHKVQATRDVLGRVDRNVVFIDSDCWLNYDPAETFDLSFELAVTRLNNLATAVSTGIFFIKDVVFMREFCNKWQALQDDIWLRHPELRERTCSHSQAAFSALCRQYQSSRRILDLPVEIYNRKVKQSVLTDVLKERDMIKVFHFYNLAFRDKECVRSIIGGNK